jgi:hypothetical protein
MAERVAWSTVVGGVETDVDELVDEDRRGASLPPWEVTHWE